jgi:YVTN family beta-propeller protein
MAILSTGPIENRPVGGVRPTQQVTIKFVNRDSTNSSTVLVQGYYLNGTRTLYVLEVVSLIPNEVATRNYFANFDSFEFVFTTSGPAAESTEISVWGKNASGQLVTAHRLVSDELLGSEVVGPQGPQGAQGPQGEQGPPGSAGSENICFENLQTKLQNCTGQIISLTIRGCCDPLQGRLTEVEDGVLILDNARVFSLCDVTFFSPIFIAYVTNALDDNVSVISTATNMEISARIPIGDLPFGIAITPDGSRAYVTNLIDNNVSVINTSTNTEIAPRIPVGNLPFGIAITPDGSRAYVANADDDNVSVINTATNTEIFPRIPVGDLPADIAITPDGSRAYVTNSGDDNVSVINTSTNMEILPRIPVGDGPVDIAITPDGSRAYVINTFDNNVSVINTATNMEILPRIPVGNAPQRVAITPNCV